MDFNVQTAKNLFALVFHIFLWFSRKNNSTKRFLFDFPPQKYFAMAAAATKWPELRCCILYLLRLCKENSMPIFPQNIVIFCWWRRIFPHFFECPCWKSPDFLKIMKHIGQSRKMHGLSLSFSCEMDFAANLRVSFKIVPEFVDFRGKIRFILEIKWFYGKFFDCVSMATIAGPRGEHEGGGGVSGRCTSAARMQFYSRTFADCLAVFVLGQSKM